MRAASLIPEQQLVWSWHQRGAFRAA